MVIGFRNIFLILFLSVTIVFAQSNKSIKEKEGELKNLKVQINKLEKELEENKNNEKATVKILEKINYQTHLLNKIIKDLDKEERVLSSRITKLSDQVTTLEKEINELKNDYAEYIKWLYINGKEAKWNYFFKSNSFNQAIIRYKYFNYITDKNEERLKKLIEKKEELKNISAKLEAKNIKKKQLEKEKIEEINRLAKREAEKNELISTLHKNQKNIEKEITEKRKFEIEIKSRIAKLIEEERERERKLREEKFRNNSAKPITPKVNYASFQNFSELKGKMNWPVTSGKIVRKFGENKNAKLKTVTLNYGVDIKAKSNEKVFAVAEGVISVIDWIPGFGSIIIITHKGNFRTVYGHIDNIQVNEGDVVKAGTELGTVNRSLEGDIIHFEIWDERNYKNPQKWLVKK